MDPDNLRTASLYINNQLLSRGLLRNGQSIDFARPDRGEGGLEASMGRIMSVVNDLILRRDRDATQRETLTTTLRTLRADSLRQTTDLERVQTKYAEAQRKLGIQEAAERGFKTQIKSAENAVKVLREEMARMKTLVQQSRNQCAVEVRKRERVIEGLKKHVGDGQRVRGGGKAVGVREISVVGGVGEGEKGGSASTMDEGYDLRSETNEFLTELARGLSEENENLAALVRRTVEDLRTLSGWEKEGRDEVVEVVEMGYESLAGEMDAVIEHVRTLLTNPSFVPLEEVEVREEEIIRLREGWEKMESRWRDAVQMMDGWRKRMARSGQTVNLEELKMGLLLSPLKTKDENEQHQLSTLMEEAEGEGDTQADIDAMDESEMVEPVEPDFDEDLDDSDSSLFEEEPVDEISEEVSEEASEEQMEEEEPNYTIHTTSSTSPGPAPQLSPLKETSGNKVAILSPKPREQEGFTTIIEENTYDLLQIESSPKRLKSAKSTPQTSTRQQRATPSTKLTPPEDEISLLKATNTALPPSRRRERSISPDKSSRATPRLNPNATPRLQRSNESRLPRPREQPPMQSPLTMASIAAKLAASEREADAARVRAKIKAARANRTKTSVDDKKLMPPPPTPQQQAREEPARDMDVDEFDVGKAQITDCAGEGVSRKRKARDVGRSQKASRRRSTLSPWELESLILGNVASPVKGES
ncbi:uncharacterized protein LY89DRAFT_668137 [Mollisia scopiformis]|uniref:NIMA interactive protein n=1 Tax=Mollisia scopiformis TaxID=149040 RepID=A0A194XCP8_MOLSC|nr:uncharacterized protein LY89DRAFT_668137 [Mollisia scopiformis]KUJ17926.1 hypothetical protein LY89DRAFT_668137 [Mollisia scopiformis]